MAPPATCPAQRNRTPGPAADLQVVAVVETDSATSAWGHELFFSAARQIGHQLLGRVAVGCSLPLLSIDGWGPEQANASLSNESGQPRPDASGIAQWRCDRLQG